MARERYDLADDFKIPPRNADKDSVLEFTNHCIARGLSFLKGQPAYADIDKGHQLVHCMETYNEAIPDKLSHVRVPRIKRQIREIVATLSNLRPTSDYVANDPAKYESQAGVLNKLYRAWYFGEEVDRSIRQALQYAASEGTGYLYLTWEKPLRAKIGRIKLTPLGALSYLPVQQSANNKIQDAEVGIICTEIPVARARRLYNKPKLQPTNSTATNLVKGGVLELITNVMSPYLRASGPNRRRNSDANTPTVNIYHLYIKDDSINTGKSPVEMGEFKTGKDGQRIPATTFSYTVPYVGQDIPTGRFIPEYDDSNQPRLNPMTNEPVLTEETRPAEPADCMLYPNLRLIIATPTDILYDGPSMWWHGKIPVVQFRMDDWPWNFLGFSLVRDTWRLEESITGRLRARDDATNARLNPALMYDSRMSEEFDKNFTPRIPGGRIVKPPMVDKPVESVVPWQAYEVSPNVDAEIMSDEKRLDFLMGISEIDALMRLKQMPQSDSLDKLLGASSSILIDCARNMESSISILGEMWKVMAMQYCTVAERLSLLGQDGITPEDFDFDPGNMIPSHLPGEDPSKPSRATKFERARFHVDSFRFNVIPNSLTQITAITRKMLYMQMWRDKSYPMDPWTFSEVMEVPNIGPAPAGANNMIDRWQVWMKTYAQFMMSLQQAAAPGMEQVTNPLAGDQSHPGPGRKPTGQVPPHFEHGGSTIAES